MNTKVTVNTKHQKEARKEEDSESDIGSYERVSDTKQIPSSS